RGAPGRGSGQSKKAREAQEGRWMNSRLLSSAVLGAFVSIFPLFFGASSSAAGKFEIQVFDSDCFDCHDEVAAKSPGGVLSDSLSVAIARTSPPSQLRVAPLTELIQPTNIAGIVGAACSGARRMTLQTCDLQLLGIKLVENEA
ncbi:MAG: hypothetical protein AAF585_15655, partial [Verrucomicrobiota bacterium]